MPPVSDTPPSTRQVAGEPLPIDRIGTAGLAFLLGLVIAWVVQVV